MRFAVLVLTVFLGGLAPAPSLDALLARARERSGAPYRYHVVSRSHAVRGGRTLQIATDALGSRYRTRTCWKTLCAGYYFDGERGFDANLNDTALPVGVRLQPEVTLRAIVSYAFADERFGDLGGRVGTCEPTARALGRGRCLAITAPHGTELLAFADARTGLVDEIVAGEHRYRLVFDGTARGGGTLRLPDAIVRDGVEIERFEDRAISRDPLAPPPGLVPTIADGRTTVPFVGPGLAGVQPVVACALGDVRVRCLLDTGNSGLAISLDLAERLGLEPQGGTLDIEGVGSYATGVVTAPALRVGGATYPPAVYTVLHDVARFGYDVVLGADAFAHATVTLDYGRRTLTLAPEAEFGAPTSLAIGFADFLPVASIDLPTQTLSAIVDTGDEAGLDVAYDAYARDPTLFVARDRVAVGGVGGASEAVVGRLEHARLGPFDVAPVPVAATRGRSSTARPRVGGALLAHFVVTFGYAQQRIGLTPIAGDGAVRAATP